jgi:hypothetical protein
MLRRLLIGLCCLLLAGCVGQAQRPTGSESSPSVESPKQAEVPIRTPAEERPAAPSAGKKGPQPAVQPDLKTRYKGALSHLLAKRYEQAEASLAQLVREKENSGTLRLAHAFALWGLGKRTEAAAECQQAADRQTPGAAECLTELQGDLPVLPAGEEQLGDYSWDAHRGYRWTGPARSDHAEFVRVSPPTVCAYKRTDGFWVFNYSCGANGRVFQWSFDPPFAGKSPLGIGLGTPLAEVERAWGKGLEQPEGLCWYTSAIRVCVQPSDDQRSVGRILVQRRGLAYLVPTLYYKGPPL